MDKCASCGEPIVFGLTPKGKRMPLDPEPVEGGNVVLGQDGHGRVTATKVANGEGTHVTHFATCPDAARFRKRDRKARA